MLNPVTSDLAGAVGRELEELPRPLFDVPSMLSYDERALLRLSTRALAPREGAVVDAGCFLGGSTLALADGLRARAGGPQEQRIHSFDLFRVGERREQAYFGSDFGFRVGADTRLVFESLIAPYSDLVTVHQGDVTASTEPFPEPIALLFIDIAKTWATNDAVVRRFFGRLRPGAIVVQQDLVHFGHPWCALTMELLETHFEYLGHIPYSSAVYRLTEPVAQAELPLNLLGRLSAETMTELIDRCAARIGEPDRGYLDLAAAWALAWKQRPAQALAVLEAVAENPAYAELPWLGEHIETLAAAIDRRVAIGSRGRMPR